MLSDALVLMETVRDTERPSRASCGCRCVVLFGSSASVVGGVSRIGSIVEFIVSESTIVGLSHAFEVAAGGIGGVSSCGDTDVDFTQSWNDGCWLISAAME